MKIGISKPMFALVALYLVLFMANSNPSAFADNLIRISTGEWAPWCGENLQHQGFVLHVVKEAFSRLDYKVEFVFLPWKRAYYEMKRGGYDASAYWYGNSKIQDECYLSDPITKETYVFFYHKKNPVNGWKTIDDLKGLRAGIVEGFSYTDELWEAIDEGSIIADPTHTDYLNLLKLIKDRVDIVPMTIVTGTKLIHEKIAPEIAATIKYDENPLSVKNGHLILPKNKKGSKNILRIFNKGLEIIKNDGTYDQYMDALISGKYSDPNN